MNTFKYALFLVAVILLSLCGCTSSKKKLPPEVIVRDLQKKSALKEGDSILYYLQKADSIIAVSERVSDSLKAENNFLLGVYYRDKNNLIDAARYFNTATDFAKDTLYLKRKHKYFFEAWEAYYRTNRYGDCLSIADKVSQIIPNEDHWLNPWLYYYYAATFEQMNEMEEAIKYEKLRLKFSRKHDTLGLTPTILNLVNYKYKLTGDLKESFRVLDSLLINKENLRFYALGGIYGYYGVYKYYEGHYAEAKDYYLKAVSMYKSAPEPKKHFYFGDIIFNYSNAVEAFIDMGEYTLANQYLDTIKAYGIGRIDQRIQKSLLEYELRIVTRTQKDVRSVLNTLDSIYSYQNELFKNKFTKELDALKVANENQQTLLLNQQAAEFNNQRLLRTMIIGGILIVLLSLLGWLLYRQKKMSLERQKLQAEQRLLRAQLKPHFTFNTLSVIQSMIEANPSEAKRYLTKFSRLLVAIFESSTNNYVQLGQELETLVQYMELQKIRVKEGFSFNIDTKGLDVENTYVPGMLLQPVIENAIIHGFANIDYHGHIEIRLKKENNFIACVVEDNGTGIAHGEVNKNTNSSTALISEFLEKVTGSKYTVRNKKEMTKGSTGTQVNFLIPFKTNSYA